MAGTLTVAALAFVWQGYPIVRGEHEWYNPIPIHYEPWTTWWKGLGRVLPQFGQTTHIIGIPSRTFPFELLLAAALVAVFLWWMMGRAPSQSIRPRIGQHART